MNRQIYNFKSIFKLNFRSRVPKIKIIQNLAIFASLHIYNVQGVQHKSKRQFRDKKMKAK